MEHEIIDGIEYISIPKPTDIDVEILTEIKEETRLLQTVSQELIKRKAIISGKTKTGKEFKMTLIGKFAIGLE